MEEEKVDSQPVETAQIEVKQEPAKESVVPEKKSEVEILEAKKAELIGRIQKAYRKIRYKKYEQQTLEPFLKETEAVQIAPLRKRKRALEFKISTAAYTPKMEREILKQMREIDAELDKVKEVEKARRKAKYVVQDIAEAENEIKKIEEELKVIREELKKHYGAMKNQQRRTEGGYRERKQGEKPPVRNEEDDYVSLGDIALIEKE